VIAIQPRFSVTYDGATMQTYHANHGEGLPRHEHAYAHLTQCHSGSCVIRKEGVQRVLTKHDKPVNLKAGEWHEIEALENGTVFVNVFAEGKY
jgi:quercetin dioxygenase-like cupin family protein